MSWFCSVESVSVYFGNGPTYEHEGDVSGGKLTVKKTVAKHMQYCVENKLNNHSNAITHDSKFDAECFTKFTKTDFYFFFVK